MPGLKKTFSFAFALIGLTGLWFVSTRQLNVFGEFVSRPKPGLLAPDFALQDLDGNTITLFDLKGYAVLVNMWASWCSPCKVEMPAIQEVYEEYKDRGFVVLSVNLIMKDDLTSVESFIEEYQLSFPVLLDQEGKAEKLYQLRGLPTSFFIDRAGIIRSVVIGGPMPADVVRERVEQIMGDS